MTQMPAMSLAAVPGRRVATLEVAKEAEKRGFTGLYCPSLGDCMALCQAIGQVTNTIEFGTSIQPIYFRSAIDLARTSSFIHETSGGRFHLGIGVSHGPMHEAMGIKVGKPLSDMREYVAALHGAEQQSGPLPPITLATLRDKMLALSAEIADGAVWANGSRSHMKKQLGSLPADKLTGDFYIGDMIPTVISDDREAAVGVCRKTLFSYVHLPNYRNYWKAAGYEEEMTGIEAAIEKGDRDAIPELMSERWLSDVTLYGSLSEVREGLEAWFDTGIKTPILVPSSASGGQMKAIEELFAAFS